jgi:two-component system, LuxR family, response regulator FixJ
MNRGHIYLIDNERTRRNSLTEALVAQGYQLQTFDDAPEFLRGIDYERVPNRTCVLTHLDLAPMTGVELLDVFRSDRVTLPLVLIGALSQLQLAVKAMRYSGTYILWRPFSVSLLEQVVSSVLHEWNEEPRRSAVEEEHDSMRTLEERFASLSRRQRQVLRYVFEGNANRAIAERLGISIKTVELHRACMMKKMHADSVAALIRMMSEYRHALERVA